MKKLFLLSLFLLNGAFLFSQEVKTLKPDQKPGNGNIEELDWIPGYWAGPGLGGECEEVWLPAKDGQMMGTFRFWNEGKLLFSEFFHLIQDGESLTLKLKHFSGDLSAWEEKDEWVEFRLVEMGENILYLDGLTMERIGDKMNVYVNLGEDGQTQIEKFAYTKMTIPSH